MDQLDLDSLLELKCTAENLIFRNESSGYTVLGVKSQDQEVVAVGNMPWVNVGEGLSLVGKWKFHPSFGVQFFVERYERFTPLGNHSIVKFLSSGIVKGIGINIAERIVEKFGEETLQILQDCPGKICEIKGINTQKAKKISDKLREIETLKNIDNYLKKYSLSPDDTVKVYKILGENAINEVENNPYILCQEEIGIDFEKADIIAKNLGKPTDNSSRIKEGILYILKHNINNGHTCLPVGKFVSVASDFLEVSKELIEENIEIMLKNGDIKIENLNENNFIFLESLHNLETYCALRIKMIMSQSEVSEQDVYKKIKNIEHRSGIVYSYLQKRAIKYAVTKGIFVLTGGPGTGKTTTLQAIIEILENKGEKVLVAAPTGRAVQRICEVTRKEAKTIHRMLEACLNSRGAAIFSKNEKNLLDCDTLIVDEASMIDLTLFEAILRALPMGSRLIIVGDSDQLPSIGAGDILGDLVSSGVIPAVRLSEIFRQSQKSLIVVNAHKIVRGEMPNLSSKDNDFFFLPVSDPKKICETVVDLYTRRLPKSYGYNPKDDIQVLTLGRKGNIGMEFLNLHLQKAVNPKSLYKREINVNGFILREQDKVMQTKNNYNIFWEKSDSTQGEGIYNGDIGTVLEIDLSSFHIAVKFDEKIAVYELELAGELELAYASTVHKSQGSEFEVVILPLFGQNSRLHYRNLLYTAVTRAKSKLIIVGQEGAIKNMIENDKKAKRYSSLKYFL